MDKKEAIEFLKKSLEEIPRLARLPYNNQEVILWCNSIEDVLEKAFDRNSTEYRRFHETRIKTPSKLTRIQWQNRYIGLMRRRRTEILSIIKKYEMLGAEEKPATKTKAKDTVKLLLQLFDSLQFHPKVIEASRGLFKTGHYAQAIFEAFKAMENFVQDKSGLTLYGTNLMETVFNEENPIIKVPEAGHYYKDVQRGFKHLFIGATQGIRNPKAHKEIIQKDPYITLQYLGFASFLLKRIDYWEAGVS
jgi:uncharacterized protein (TIGR02391 family)